MVMGSLFLSGAGVFRARRGEQPVLPVHRRRAVEVGCEGGVWLPFSGLPQKLVVRSEEEPLWAALRLS